MFEVGETHKTRDGRDAKLVHVFAEPRCPAEKLLWVSGDRYWGTGLEGNYWANGDESCNDVMPPVKVAYVNMYGDCHASRESADSWSFPGRIACVRVEYHEGQFDE